MTAPSLIYRHVTEAFNRRQWPQVSSLARQLMGMGPAHASVHYMAGVAALEQQDVAHALQHLHQANMLEHRNVSFAVQYAKALSLAHLIAQSIEVADHAMRLGIGDAASLDTLGVVYTQANLHDKACAAFQEAVALVPNSAHYRFNLATSLIYDGKVDAAEQQLEIALTLSPNFAKAHLTLAHLRRQTTDRHHLPRLQALLTRTSPGLDRMYGHLALAKELEDLGDYPLAFDHLSKGKAEGRHLRPFDFERDRRVAEALIAAFPVTQQADRQGLPSTEPIFVVGMPRSGTTLVDRIVSSHPDVQSAGELQNFGKALKRLSGSRSNMMLDEDTVARSQRLDWHALGQAYLESARPMTGHARHFIDKLPLNFLYVGHIAKALPNATIICLRRNPLDTCLSNFRQLFALTSPYYDYAFDLRDTARYYAMFDRLMAHWQRVFPGRILEIPYEGLVDEQERWSRILFDHCGLTWHEPSLRFENNPAPVTTASALQVREPLNRHSIDRWRRYGDRLAPLIDALRTEGIELPD